MYYGNLVYMYLDHLNYELALNRMNKCDVYSDYFQFIRANQCCQLHSLYRKHTLIFNKMVWIYMEGNFRYIKIKGR